MPDRDVKTIKDFIYYQYAARSARELSRRTVEKVGKVRKVENGPQITWVPAKGMRGSALRSDATLRGSSLRPALRGFVTKGE
jgi:archaeosine-15-forming tRNA-guanine transglycosylase